MKILITGAKGFVGRNLVENLKIIRDGKNRTRPELTVAEIYEYDLHDTEEQLARYCKDCDFVFHLAGVNRPKEETREAQNMAFLQGNRDTAELLLEHLKKAGNTCPVMYASSTQAFLTGRFADSDYGRSKVAGEGLFFAHGSESGARILVYRLPNLFGKWCRPNYNSAVATFCHAVAHDLPYTVNDPATELELLYIDDLVNEMLDALEGREHRCNYVLREDTEEPMIVSDPQGRYCHVPVTHRVTLGEIIVHLNSFKEMPETLIMPSIPAGSFQKKLYSTYLSYLPPEKIAYPVKSNVDERGNFTELIRTLDHGQVSINIARPGNTRGVHWHNSKWEIFIVVSGHGLIRERRIGVDPETGEDYPVVEFEVTGEEMKAVQMLPGYTHSITNLSDTHDLVTVMWANELFDPAHPDTYHEEV